MEETDASKEELKMALQLVESLVGEFDPDEFENEYRNDLRGMLEAKLAGEEIKQPEPEAPAPVIDLMEALKQSVAQAHKQKAPAKAKQSSSRKRAAAR